jgi:hypothetical protein
MLGLVRLGQVRENTHLVKLNFEYVKWGQKVLRLFVQ